jgi:uncharacterized protein (TIGR02145 family)
VPTEAEVLLLVNYAGGSCCAGGVLKSTSTQPTQGGWAVPNSFASDGFDFSALPGGLRRPWGDYELVYQYGIWWTATSISTTYAKASSMSYINGGVNFSDNERNAGYSVRCIKD